VSEYSESGVRYSRAVHPDGKLSNPKDHFGSAKLDMGMVPWTLMVCAARAFLEGALKYGRYNWRITGVRVSVYHGALLRHVAKWWNGQDCDKKTRVHHLDNAIACLTIIRDAELYGKLEDDRPPCPDPDAMADLIDSFADDVVFLKDMFEDHHPKQYTINDTKFEPVEVPK
jgi:Domain of unknown function (DUF5664)